MGAKTSGKQGSAIAYAKHTRGTQNVEEARHDHYLSLAILDGPTVEYNDAELSRLAVARLTDSSRTVR